MKLFNLLFILMITNFCNAQIHINTLNNVFEDNPKPIIIYFFTDWCTVCKLQKNEIKKTLFSKQNIENEVYFLQLNGESKENITFLGQTFQSNSTDKNNNLHDFILNFEDPNQINFPFCVILTKDLEIIGKYNGLIKDDILIKLMNGIDIVN
mgnify:CR=1 FL=1